MGGEKDRQERTNRGLLPAGGRHMVSFSRSRLPAGEKDGRRPLVSEGATHVR